MKKARQYTDEHAEAGARLALAFRPDDDIVLPHHLAAVQGNATSLTQLLDDREFGRRRPVTSYEPADERLAHLAAANYLKLCHTRADYRPTKKPRADYRPTKS